MAPPRRLIRRQPLADRIKGYLNPYDFLLWLSEELETSDWDNWQKTWGTPLGLVLNLTMLIARANVGASGGYDEDDVFGDDEGVSYLEWFATFIVHLLSLMSFVNAIYTFYRKRHYRLFEAPVDAPPSTPSARRVRVDSSPVSSSPLRFLSGVMGSNSAQARAHPNSKTDVWEISVWDPTPLCLKLFCLFSPGHVLMYWFFLPTLPEDPRPSTTVVTALSLAILLSVQLLLLQQSFSQQSKDSSLIHKEVFNEYDIKYVHPHTHPLMRDVGTQVSSSGGKLGRSPARSDGVDTYMPVTIVNKGFQTNPNPNYLGHVDPDAYKAQETPNRAPSRNPAASSAQTPSFYTPLPTRDFPSPLQQRTAFRKPQPQQRASVGPGTGDGGSLGVYSHAHSPLKKAASQNFAAQRGGQRRQEKTRLSDWM